MSKHRSQKAALETRREPPPQDVIVAWNGPDCGMRRFGPNDRYPPYLAAIAGRQEMLRATEDPVRTIVTPDGWKFNCSPAGEHELYHLEKDPMEMNNLAGTSGGLQVMKDLIRRLRQWQQRTADDVVLPVFA